jgi:glutamate dehydrogenase (NAD(P)+)
MTHPNLYDLVNKQYEKALCVTELTDEIHEILSQVFKGYRVQHNNILGPYKGGLRFHHGVYLDECKALAFWMTLKCSLQGLPLGGGKGGIKFNPRDYSRGDLKKISKAFAKALYKYIGSDIDVPAPDMGTNDQIMDWMTDAYNQMHPERDFAVFTGKSAICKGNVARSGATGMGIYLCIKQWAKTNGVNLKGRTYILQGFGNVGSHTATLLHGLGMILIGVGDHTCYISYEEGLNVYKLDEYNRDNGSLEGYHIGSKISKEEFFSLKCDIVIPAALELQIDADIAQKLNCKLVVEAANGPTNVEADDIMLERGIDLIPDILANSGGVIVSYLEWLQNKQHTTFEADYVNDWLERRMINTYNKVDKLSKDRNISKRMASYNIALSTINEYYHRLKN